MSLDVFRSTYFAYVHSILSYGIIFWGNSSHSAEIFKVQKRIIRIIMNLSKNASCRQWSRELNILPVPSQYILSLLLFITKNKGQFMTSSQMHRITTRKLLICTYPQQTWQYTKKVFITKESRLTVIYQKLLKTYLVIKINLN